MSMEDSDDTYVRSVHHLKPGSDLLEVNGAVCALRRDSLQVFDLGVVYRSSFSKVSVIAFTKNASTAGADEHRLAAITLFGPFLEALDHRPCEGCVVVVECRNDDVRLCGSLGD
jgi:hypothetical protein